MDVATKELHLAKAEDHVAQGERNLARQMIVVAKLERSGLDSAAAQALLTTFEKLQVLHEADRDRLRAELDRTPSAIDRPEEQAPEG